MQLVKCLDPAEAALNNEAMYKRAAKRVRDWRKDHHDMNQIAFAKLAGVSVGCLQGFETGTRQTREDNVRKIAGTMGLTLEQLLSEDAGTIEAPDPLLKDLRVEDLRLANQFHHAAAAAKYATKLFLSPTVSEETRERVAAIVEHLLRLDATLLTDVEDLLAAYQGPPAGAIIKK